MPRFVALAAVLTLLLILAVRRRASARRLARLRRAQEKWGGYGPLIFIEASAWTGTPPARAALDLLSVGKTRASRDGRLGAAFVLGVEQEGGRPSTAVSADVMMRNMGEIPPAWESGGAFDHLTLFLARQEKTPPVPPPTDPGEAPPT